MEGHSLLTVLVNRKKIQRTFRGNGIRVKTQTDRTEQEPGGLPGEEAEITIILLIMLIPGSRRRRRRKPAQKQGNSKTTHFRKRTAFLPCPPGSGRDRERRKLQEAARGKTSGKDSTQPLSRPDMDRHDLTGKEEL